MDITQQFREITSQVQASTDIEELLVEAAKNETDAKDQLNKKLFKSSPSNAQKTSVKGLHKQCTEVLKKLEEVEQAIEKNWSSYTSAVKPVNGNNDMPEHMAKLYLSDADRKLIDQQIDLILRNLKTFTNDMKEQSGTVQSQLKDHIVGLSEVLESKQREFQAKVNNLKSERRKGEADMKAIEKMSSDQEFWNDFLCRKKSGRLDEIEFVGNDSADSKETSKESKSVPDFLPHSPKEYDEKLFFKDDELVEMQQQEELIYEDIIGLRKEVASIAGQIYEVVNLQEMFAQKVVEQEQAVDVIEENVQNVDDNIIGANKELFEAISSSTSFTYWLAFTLLTLSFTLLFLHWYND